MQTSSSSRLLNTTSGSLSDFEGLTSRPSSNASQSESKTILTTATQNHTKLARATLKSKVSRPTASSKSSVKRGKESAKAKGHLQKGPRAWLAKPLEAKLKQSKAKASLRQKRGTSESPFAQWTQQCQLWASRLWGRCVVLWQEPYLSEATAAAKGRSSKISMKKRTPKTLKPSSNVKVKVKPAKKGTAQPQSTPHLKAKGLK